MHEAAAREHAEKVKAKEEERRAEKVKQLEALQNGQGYNNKSSSQKKSTLRSDGKCFSVHKIFFSHFSMCVPAEFIIISFVNCEPCFTPRNQKLILAHYFHVTQTTVH